MEKKDYIPVEPIEIIPETKEVRAAAKAGKTPEEYPPKEVPSETKEQQEVRQKEQQEIYIKKYFTAEELQKMQKKISERKISQSFILSEQDKTRLFESLSGSKGQEYAYEVVALVEHFKVNPSIVIKLLDALNQYQQQKSNQKQMSEDVFRYYLSKNHNVKGNSADMIIEIMKDKKYSFDNFKSYLTDEDISFYLK